MFRAIVLSLIFFVALGGMIPVATNFSEAKSVSQQRVKKKKKRAKRYRRASTARKSKRKRTKRRYRSRKRYRGKRYRKSSRRYRSKKRYKARSGRKMMSNAAWRRFVKRKNARKRARRKNASRYKKRRYQARKKVYRKKRSKKRYRKSKKRYRSKRRYVAKKRYRKSTKRTRRAKRTRKYSKKWWRNYRAKQRRQQRLAARKRSNKLRSLRAKKKRAATKKTGKSVRRATIAAKSNPMDAVQAPYVPVADGNVAVEVVGASVGKTVSKGRRTQVGGVSTVNLRRIVIDQMIRENGWVENDYHTVVDGKQVYVVVAKAPGKNGLMQQRTYYFTESNGRIYRVSTKSTKESSDKAKEDSAKMIRALKKSEKPQQAAKKKVAKDDK